MVWLLEQVLLPFAWPVTLSPACLGTRDKALINRMGLITMGVDVAERIKDYRKTLLQKKLIIGGNIGEKQSNPNESCKRLHNVDRL